MVVKCAPSLRSNVFAFTKNLKGKKNSLKQQYFVDPQLPEKLQADRKELNYQMGVIKKENKEKAPEDQLKVKIKNRKLYVNNEAQRKKVVPPTVSTILNLTREDYDSIEALLLSKSKETQDQGSVFTGYGTKVSQINEVANFYQAVKIRHPECDHILMAYRINGVTGSCDDGEHGGGIRLQKLLVERDENNVVVFIAREYGRVLLGARRFTHILAKAREVLNTLNTRNGY